MHDRLECTHSHGALLDLPDSHQPHPNGSTPTIQPTLFALSLFPQLPLLFIFCRPLQHHRSSSSLLEQCLLCSLLQFPSVLADCLEPEPIKKKYKHFEKHILGQSLASSNHSSLWLWSYFYNGYISYKGMRPGCLKLCHDPLKGQFWASTFSTSKSNFQQGHPSFKASYREL